MKSILIFVTLLVVLSSCDMDTTSIEPKVIESKVTSENIAETIPKITEPLQYNGVYINSRDMYSYDGMTYITIYGTNCMNTINYTKDSLEVLLLKKQLSCQ